MNRQMVMMVVTQLMMSMMDGKLTGDEAAQILSMVAKMYGFSKGDFHEVFIETDGDLHLILKKSALDKMSISF